MTLRSLFLVSAVLLLASGAFYLLLPETALALYGLTTGPAEIVLMRAFGVSAIGVGLVCLFFRNSEATEPDSAFAVARALLVVYALAALVTGQATLGGTLNALGWVAVIAYALLAGAVGYLVVVRRAAAGTQRGP